jgi:hypothetical protein
MIHIRIDDSDDNAKRRFLCGLGPALPPGDVYLFDSEARKAAFHKDEVCPGCYLQGRPQFGAPLSELSGRPGEPGWEKFKAIARSWGYD